MTLDLFESNEHLHYFLVAVERIISHVQMFKTVFKKQNHENPVKTTKKGFFKVEGISFKGIEASEKENTFFGRGGGIDGNDEND